MTVRKRAIEVYDLHGMRCETVGRDGKGIVYVYLGLKYH